MSFMRWLHVARLDILWVSVAMEVVLAAQSRDKECGPAVQGAGERIRGSIRFRLAAG